MNSKKRIVSVFLSVILVLSSSTITAFANEKDQENLDTPSGRVMISLEMSEEEGAAYKESMKVAVKQAIESFKEEVDMTNDSEKKEFLFDMIQESESIDYDTVVQQKADGSYNISVPEVNGKVMIDGIEYSTDINGYYYLPDNSDLRNMEEPLDEKEIRVYKEDFLIAQDENLEVNAANGEIVISRTLSELGEGIARMGEDMAQGQVNIMYPQKKVGEYYGNGVGRSKIYRDVNIVGCNKHDKDTNSINTVEFALQGSDCSSSVKLGLLYAQNPSGLPGYWMSFYCVDEAISSEDGGTNIYCNGKLKDGRTNCSWFTGIGHTESFHTHA